MKYNRGRGDEKNESDFVNAVRAFVCVFGGGVRARRGNRFDARQGLAGRAAFRQCGARRNGSFAAKEFADRLAKGETTLAFSDFAGAEKISYPSPPFTLSDAEGCDPEIGDVTIYKPWGNIAIFYRDSSGYSSDLVYLGKIEGDGIGIFAAQSGDFTVTLRLAGD